MTRTMKDLCTQLLHPNPILLSSRRSSGAFTQHLQRNKYCKKLSHPGVVFAPVPFTKIRCSTTLSLAEEVSKKKTFCENEAGLLVNELRQVFSTGKTKSYEWRVAQLKSIEKMLVECEKDIYEALYRDLGKPEIEAFLAEVSQVKSSCDHALRDLKHWMEPENVKTSITTFPSKAQIVSEPLGVVLVISTWNFPFLLSMDPVIGAISAGNAVVLKPSEIAPATSTLLSNLVEKYLDSSAVRVVEGDIPETTALLEQKWDKILYTGSARVGRIVMAAAAKHLTPVILELGGKCPAVVDSNIDIQVTCRRIITGKWTLNSGQACIGVDYVITTKDFAPKLIDALKQELENFFGKNPLTSKDMSRIVGRPQFERLLKLLNEEGVADKIVLGGQSDEDALRIAPTVLLNVPGDTQIMNEEIFGPLMPIVTVEKIEDSFDIINAKPKPLAAYLFTNNDKLKDNYVQNVSSGGMLINDTVLHVTADGLPFGGVGESGMGSYHGKFSFDGFSHKKAVLYKGFSGDVSIRYPPFNPQKEKILRALLAGDYVGALFALIG